MRQQNQKDVQELSLSRTSQKVPAVHQGPEEPPAVHGEQSEGEDKDKEMHKDPKVHKEVPVVKAAAEDKRTGD